MLCQAHYKLELAKFWFGSVASLKFDCLIQTEVVAIVNNQILSLHGWTNVAWTDVAWTNVAWSNGIGSLHSVLRGKLDSCTVSVADI